MINSIKLWYKKWNWLLMVMFWSLAIIDLRFGLTALFCILPAFYLSFKKPSYNFCASSCPRGNFLQKSLKDISFNRSAPQFFQKSIFKNSLFFVIFFLFIVALFRSGGVPVKIGFVLVRFITVSTIIGMLTGLIYQPRSWCQICPLGQGTNLIKKGISQSDNRY